MLPATRIPVQPPPAGVLLSLAVPVAVQVREECWKIQQLRLHSMKAGELYTVQEFKAAQAAQAEVAKERLLKFSETVSKCAYELCYEVMLLPPRR